MQHELRIRMYNVGLGDCILITLPAERRCCHLLVDFGSTRGKDKKYLDKVYKDIVTTVEEEPLAVILTHGHIDHFKGLYNHLKELDAHALVFLTTQHLRTPETVRMGTRDGPILRLIDSVMTDIRNLLREEEADEATTQLAKERVESDEMLDALCRQLGNRVRYLTRGVSGVLTPFLRGTGTELNVLAPERDNESYAEQAFARLVPVPERSRIGRGLLLERLRARIADRERVPLRDLLMAEREYDNNTSLVLSLEWRGKRILFAGDAEITSWRTMYEKGVLRPVDVLKVAHHASANGTPIRSPEIWNKMTDGGQRDITFLVSTYPRKDWGMPDRELLTQLTRIGKVYSTEGMQGEPAFIDVTLTS